MNVHTLDESAMALDSAAAKRLRAVVIDEEVPYPLNTGKRIRTFNLISRLADKHQITYLCHRNADEDEFHAGRKQLESLGIACHLIPRELPAQSVLSKGPSFYASLAWNLLSSWPYVVQKNNSSALRREIVNLNRSGEVDVWHCEWTPYAAPFLGHSNQPWLFVAHNIESLIWKRYAETEPNRLKKWYIRRQLNKLRRFERTAFQTARSAVVVSPEDAKLAQDWFDAESVDVVDNGVDIQYFSPR